MGTGYARTTDEQVLAGKGRAAIGRHGQPKADKATHRGTSIPRTPRAIRGSPGR